MAKLGVVEWIALVDKNDNFDWHFDEGLSLDLVCGIWNVCVLKDEDGYER